MALKVAGYSPERLFAKQNRVIGFDRQIVTNDFKRIQGKETLLQCVNSILSTPRGRRIRDATFGSELYKYAFEPADDTTAQLIRQEVINSLQEQDERIKVRNVRIQMFTDQKGFAVDVEISLPTGEAYKQQVTITPEVFDILEEEDEE